MFKPNSTPPKESPRLPTGQAYKILAVVCSVIVTAAIGYLLVWAGNLDSPGAPASTGQMYTLDQIYTYLTTGYDSDWPTKHTSFTEPAGAPTSGTMHTLDDIKGKITRNPATGQTTSYGTKQKEDGYYESGATLRYSTTTVGSDIIVNDLNTGLMWEQKTSGNKATTYTWENAQIYCEDQIGSSGTYGGYDDWRLPNAKELFSIVVEDAGLTAPYIDHTYFPNTVSAYYWSSTTAPGGTSFALGVYFSSGGVYGYGKTDSYYVRCVRGQ